MDKILYCKKCKKVENHMFVCFTQKAGYVWYCEVCGNTTPDSEVKKRILGSSNFVDKIKGYNKLNMTYHEPEFKPIINGKKVKSWKRVRISDTDMNHDEYIPIYYKKRNERRIKNDK